MQGYLFLSIISNSFAFINTLFASNTYCKVSNLSAYSEQPLPILNINLSTGHSGNCKFNPGGGYTGVIVLLFNFGYSTIVVLKN